MEAQSQALIDYWHAIRRDDVVPSRAAFKPRDIPTLLRNIFILEYRDSGEAVYRLVGSAIVDKLGRDFTGMNHLELLPAEQRQAVAQQYRNMLTVPCGLYMRRELRSRYGAGFASEIIYLPLRNRLDQISQMIGLASVVGNAQMDMPGQISSLPADDVAYIDLGCGIPDQSVAPMTATG